mmetsp:Transcript_16120/g.11637  ORF Transcript_16120/g.11637 Transcript_16120/m.11637 type:complete len:98 (+) Transcript_16120:29-322(+)
MVKLGLPENLIHSLIVKLHHSSFSFQKFYLPFHLFFLLLLLDPFQFFPPFSAFILHLSQILVDFRIVHLLSRIFLLVLTEFQKFWQLGSHCILARIC